MAQNLPENNGARILQKYLPSESIDAVWELITRHPLDFHVVKPRRTKLGDFRFKGKNDRPQITVNGNLNTFSFFITTIHELAHFYAFQDHGRRIQAHGPEWKQTYRDLMKPFLELNFLPKDIEVALVNSLVSVKAASCTDPALYKVLKQYDLASQSDGVFLDSLELGTTFELDGRKFKKGFLRRKRFECIELSTNKKYLVTGIAQVKEIEENR